MRHADESTAEEENSENDDHLEEDGLEAVAPEEDRSNRLSPILSTTDPLVIHSAF